MRLDVRIEAIGQRRRRGEPPTLVGPLSFALPQGTTLGLVGESGSGKSLTALAIMGLLPPMLFAKGCIRLDGTDLLTLGEDRLEDVRGSRIGMIFQEPMTALNPAMRIGDQIAEGLVRHRAVSWAEARAEALRLLARVRIPQGRQRLDAYPHELSGGQRQRVGIAIALAPGPALLIADEPTTALDVTVQAEILELLGELIGELGMSLLIVSHDLGVIAGIAERVLVMSRGRAVEEGATRNVLQTPAHPETQRLLAARLQPGGARRPAEPAAALPSDSAGGRSSPPLIETRDLQRRYPSRSGHPPTQAVDGVELALWPGTIHGVVGESGSGKSTLARLVMGLDRPTAGTVFFEGEDLFAGSRARLRQLRRGFQMVFQDPYGSLDPRQTVGRIVAEPLFLDPDAPRGRARQTLVGETLESVGLRAADAGLRPHQFSGGQRQRIAIARALIGRPKLIVADEPVSALDLPVQAQVLRLILDLRDRHGQAFLFISHSLAVVETIADRVSVMQAGRIVEEGTAAEVFRTPRHAYTRALLAAEPRPGAFGFYRRGRTGVAEEGGG